jgi:hypothetical protein
VPKICPPIARTGGAGRTNNLLAQNNERDDGMDALYCVNGEDLLSMDGDGVNYRVKSM